LAAIDGREAVVRLLLEHEAGVDAKDNDGWAALHMAAGNGHDAMVRLLLEHNAYVNVEEIDGQTALLLVARRGHEAVVQLPQSTIGNLATPSSLLSSLRQILDSSSSG
jgi:ankyrin repeat protein